MWLSDTLGVAVGSLEQGEATDRGETVLDQLQSLDRFLAGVEKRAFQIARMALRDPEDALDAVQDAMLQLARRYGARPSEEWRPLFYRILQNRVRDCQRRRAVRNKILGWLPSFKEDEDAGDPYEQTPDSAQAPPDQLQTQQAMLALEIALRNLPLRQQQAFALRNFEGMDVAETAQAMGCSEGSVKTHYSRAVHTLRERLGEMW